MPRDDPFVWSTRGGRLCSRCDQPVDRCRCPKAGPVKTGDGIVRVSRETKGRKGKGMTLIHGVPLAPAELKALAKKLKAMCGSGGAVKDGVIEIQGDHRDRLVPALEKEGWTVKKVGG